MWALSPSLQQEMSSIDVFISKLDLFTISILALKWQRHNLDFWVMWKQQRIHIQTYESMTYNLPVWEAVIALS